jgi:hypothetical protein
MEFEELASLKPGGIYVFRCKSAVSSEYFRRFGEYLDFASARIGCKFILLDHNLEMVKPVEIEPSGTSFAKTCEP